MFRNIILSFVFCFLVGSVIGQDYKEIQRKQDSIYQVNIRKSRIGGVYIPKNLDDAFDQLDKLSSAESKQKFKNGPEETVARKLHFGLGKWMRVNWNFDEGSRISHELRGYGIFHPDDMVNFMLRSYHRYLNNVDQDIEKRAAVYIKKRKEQVESEKHQAGAEVLETLPSKSTGN